MVLPYHETLNERIQNQNPITENSVHHSVLVTSRPKKPTVMSRKMQSYKMLTFMTVYACCKL